MTQIFEDMVTNWKIDDFNMLQFAIDNKLEWMFMDDCMIAYKALISLGND